MGFEPATLGMAGLLANHYTTNFPPIFNDICIDITKPNVMIEIILKKNVYVTVVVDSVVIS